jgi:DNA-binding NarL/FixJ family response regulator
VLDFTRVGGDARTFLPQSGLHVRKGGADVRQEFKDHLTSREVEVLRLVAAGLTNREIGDRLGVSPRTIDAHLRSIYSRLGVATRSAATRYALERRLV